MKAVFLMRLLAEAGANTVKVKSKSGKNFTISGVTFEEDGITTIHVEAE